MVTIPNSVTSIGGQAFYYCIGLSDIYSYIKDPASVTMGSAIFYSVPITSCVLHVPNGTKELYQVVNQWKAFTNILEMEPIVITATSIAFDYETVELTESETLQLTATVLPEDATDKSVTWSSSNEVVATVDSNGLVTAVAAGTATITATTNDGSDLTASCAVTVNPLVISATSIALNQTTAELVEGETLQLTATVLPDDATDKTVTWTSSDEAIATVDNNGLVTAVALGTATITATTHDGTNLSASCTVTVASVLEPGDANGDGNVTVTDVVFTAQKAVGMLPSPFNEANADVNQDGSINVTDVVLTANIAVGITPNTSKAPMIESESMNFLTASMLDIEQGETQDIILSLDNSTMFSAFQMDVNLPVGMTLVGARLNDRASDHLLLIHKMEETTRLLGFSLGNTPIDGNAGTLLTLIVSAENGFETDCTLELQDILMTECNGATHRLNDIRLTNGIATGVTDVYNDTRIYAQGHDLIIEANESGMAQIILINGMSHMVKVTVGRNVLPMTSNLYIVKLGNKVAKISIK